MEQDNKNTIRLTFPNLDFGIVQGGNEIENQRHLRATWDEDAISTNCSELGSLVPHLLLKDKTSCLSLRQWMAKQCLDLGKSLTFVVELEPMFLQHREYIRNTFSDISWVSSSDLEDSSVDFLRKQFCRGEKVLVYRGDGQLAVKL